MRFFFHISGQGRIYMDDSGRTFHDVADAITHAIAQRSRPIGTHGAGVGAALAADDDPQLIRGCMRPRRITPRSIGPTPETAACSAALRPPVTAPLSLAGEGAGRRAFRQDFEGLRRFGQDGAI
jgi:hypothetical protein